MHHQLFFEEFKKNKSQIGSIRQSSKSLAKKMVNPLRHQKTKQTIVEIGAGTGAVTAELLKVISPETELIIFEINQKFCEILEQLNHPHLKIINDSAEKLPQYLESWGLQKVDCVISSLPLNSLPKATSSQIIKTVHGCLNARGLFIQFQYLPLWLPRLKKDFSQVKINFTFLNLPPAFIYTCIV